MQSKSRIHADLALHQDQFDRIPDSIVLLIFNRVADVRALGCCSVVSKRFNSLATHVHDVYVKIDRIVSIDGDPSDESLNPMSSKPHNLFSHLLKLMLLAIFKPFHHLQNRSSSLKPLVPQVSRRSSIQVLKKFTHIRNLCMVLPAGDVGTDDGVLLKWRAEFGSTLQNCVILGGTRIYQRSNDINQDPSSAAEDNQSIPESFYTNGGLKLRVVWTISSLIAASTRHYLLRPIIKNHPTLRSLVLTDADGQGTLTMGVEQLREFREKLVATPASTNRTQVPASNMKLKYAPHLDLPEGIRMQGATLVAIRPSGEGIGGSNGGSMEEAEAFMSSAFDGHFMAAVKALVKRRTYLLEMNGF